MKQSIWYLNQGPIVIAPQLIRGHAFLWPVGVLDFFALLSRRILLSIMSESVLRDDYTSVAFLVDDFALDVFGLVLFLRFLDTGAAVSEVHQNNGIIKHA